MSLDPAPARYAAHDEAALVEVVRRHPFAWVIGGAGGFSASPLPLRPIVGEDGSLTGFLGHFARSNPQVARLRDGVDVHVLVTGPHAYVSPSWLDDRTQAPTWNHVTAVFACRFQWLAEAGSARAVLSDLVGEMERGRPGAWSIPEMGERYERLERGVAPFRADIRDRRVVWKLGQDERADLFPQILNGLRVDGQAELADLMEGAATA